MTLVYVDLLADFNLIQPVKEHSWVCNLSATLIGHVIGSNSFQVSEITQAIGLNDHNVQIVVFNLPIFRYAPKAMMAQSFKKCA